MIGTTSRSIRSKQAGESAIPSSLSAIVGSVRRIGMRAIGPAALVFMLSVLLTGTASAADPTVPDKPGLPSLRVVALDTIEVNWNAPADGGEEILRYLLEYRRAGEDFSISKVISEDEARPIRISDLQAESTYSFRVAAANRLGASPFSEETTVRLIPGAIQSGETTTETDDSTLPRVIGRTNAATATEVEGDRVVITRHDAAGTPFEIGVGWIAKDGSSQVVVGFIRDVTLGQTYNIVRYEDTGKIVRRWIAPHSQLVYSIPWAIVNSQFSVPVEVVSAIPLDHRFPEANQLARRFDGGEERIYVYDASLLKWRHIPDWPTFQALNFYWCDVTAADEEFFERIAIGDQFPKTTLPERANYPNCATG